MTRLLFTLLLLAPGPSSAQCPSDTVSSCVNCLSAWRFACDTRCPSGTGRVKCMFECSRVWNITSTCKRSGFCTLCPNLAGPTYTNCQRILQGCYPCTTCAAQNYYKCLDSCSATTKDAENGACTSACTDQLRAMNAVCNAKKDPLISC